MTLEKNKRSFVLNRVLLKFIVPVIGFSACNSNKEAASKTPSPNIILIYLDDLNNFQIGCYGGNVSTPNIDKLAEEGIKFTHYYASSALCTPSRFSALTGRYASRCLSLKEQFPENDNAFIFFNTDINEGETTIAHILKKKGYATGFTGKWHNWSGGLLPLRHVPDRENPEAASIKAVIEDNYRITKEHIKKTSGFDYVEAVYATNFNWLPITSRLMFHNQHWITYHSLKFIEENKDKPFSLYMATTIPHYPHAIESLRNDPRATPAGFLTEHLDCQPSYKNLLERGAEAGMENESELNTWLTMAWLDDGIEAIMNKLDELGLRENTLIIFASDNESAGKETCYQGRVPFIINWKDNIKGGKVCSELVSNIDLVPTILDVANIKKPANIKLDGISLNPLFNDTYTDWRKSLYLEVTYTRGVVTNDYNYIAVRFPKDIRRLINDTNRGEFTQRGVRLTKMELDRFQRTNRFPAYFDDDQLYDLNNDSLEKVNLAYKPEYFDTLENMKSILRSYSADLPYPFGEFKSDK